MSTTFIAILIAAVSILLLLAAFLRRRKNSALFYQYCEAMQAENNGDAEKAILLYREALQQSRKTKMGDKRLMGDIEGRLKTLIISSDFEKSFRRKGLAV